MYMGQIYLDGYYVKRWNMITLHKKNLDFGNLVFDFTNLNVVVISA